MPFLAKHHSESVRDLVSHESTRIIIQYLHSVAVQFGRFRIWIPGSHQMDQLPNLSFNGSRVSWSRSYRALRTQIPAVLRSHKNGVVFSRIVISCIVPSGIEGYGAAK